MASKLKLTQGEAQLARERVRSPAPSVLAASDTPAHEPLSIFELPSDLVKPALEACRLFNTSIDALFYDVPALVDALRSRGETVAATANTAASAGRGQLDLGALKNPEGSLLVIDPRNPPYVKAFDDVTVFLAERDGAAKQVEIATIAGVGSSALGSAALAWDVSSAFRKPVLAIVPGYGVADVLLQALGGWYGFGMYDFLNAKSHLQDCCWPRSRRERPRSAVGFRPRRRGIGGLRMAARSFKPDADRPMSCTPSWRSIRSNGLSATARARSRSPTRSGR